MVSCDSFLELWTVKTQDDVAANVGDGHATEVSVKFFHKFVVGCLVGLNVFGYVWYAHSIKPLHFGVTKSTPAGAVDYNFGCSCVAHIYTL